ncbi:hypothetical protein K0M31_005484 [Melipona bicolor]|uniref:Uncharacterized protein n=1 Tax=Melipona bicolor TaxID=60889 RepID=A0AA40FV58_9HYME|nr:hypothetical protein K0M31_005484 [Melipona bicolor]
MVCSRAWPEWGHTPAADTPFVVAGRRREVSERNWTPVTHLQPYCSTSTEDKERRGVTLSGTICGPLGCEVGRVKDFGNTLSDEDRGKKDRIGKV